MGKSVMIALVVGVVAALLGVWASWKLGEGERDKGQMRVFTGEALAKGVGDAPQLLLALLGAVFDVTEGRRFYGNGGGYNFFAGRDATRAFVTGDFTEAGLIDDVRDLSRAQWKELMKWKRFFNEKYTFVGVLGGGHFYDAAGVKSSLLLEIETTETEKMGTKPAAASADATTPADTAADTATDKAAVAAAAAETQAAESESAPGHPRCNKRWTSGAGGQVWCEDGYPRAVLVSDAGLAKHFTCQCVPNSSVLDDNHQLYDGCEHYEKQCAV